MGESIVAFVELVDDAPVPTVRVGGELDAAVAPTLRDQLDLAIAAGSGDVLIDMAGVTFLDSTAVNELVRAHVALCDAGRSLVVADLAPVVTRTFAITGLLDSCPRWSDQDERGGGSQQSCSLHTYLPVSVGAQPHPSVTASTMRRPPAAPGIGGGGHLRAHRVVVVVNLDPQPPVLERPHDRR